MNMAAMKLLCLIVWMGCCGQGTAQFQSCHSATGCGGNEVTGVSNASDCCLGSGLSFRDGGTCRQCIVHGFVRTTDLVLNEGSTQAVIRMILDIKGNTLLEPASTRVLNFGSSFTCIDSSNGGGPMAVDDGDYTDTGCGNNIELRLFPSSQRRSEVGINAVADDKIEGTEVLILQLVLTSATQTAVNNAGNIFFQDTLNIRVIDVTAVLIGFSEDDYTGDEGEPGDVSLPNTPCTVTVEIIERTLEIPLQIRLTPGELNATRLDFNDTVIVKEVPVVQAQVMQAIQIFDDEINEGGEVFNVSLEVVSNISNTVQYRIQTALCRIPQSDSIEIGFTQRRINHTEVIFQQFDVLINKSRVSEQTFLVQIEISTLNSPFGQSATRGADFQTGLPGMSTVVIRLPPYQPNALFSYQILGDNTPENQEVFQLSVTPAIGSPTFTCNVANGCFQQLEVVIVDDDGTAQFQSCHSATGCGGNEVTGVSIASDCCLGSGLSFRDGGTCRQCIVHGFVRTTDLVLNEGSTQAVIRMILDIKGNTLLEPASTRVLNFGSSFTCIDSSNGGGPMAVDDGDYTDTGCGNNIELRLFPSSQRRSEVGINAVADDKIEGTEVLILQLVLTSATQTAVNNAGNIFFQDTLNIRVIDVTAVVIGFSADDYTGDEGEPGDVSRPNTPCTVTVEIIERSLEIPLQIRFTPGEGNATRRDFNDTVIVTEVPVAQTLLVQAIEIFDDEINEGQEDFSVSLEVVSNISNAVQYRIQTALCRIRQSDPIEIGFTRRRIFHTEEFRVFDTLINKSRVSEQTFIAQFEISTLNSPFGQSATRGEDFEIGVPGLSTVFLELAPSQPNRLIAYQILGDNVPEYQKVFQLSVTPEIGSPTFTCTQANGCFQQLEIVIVDDDVVMVGFVETLVEVNETDGNATLNVSITMPEGLIQIMFSLRVDSMDGSAASHSAIDTPRNPIPGVEDFPQIVDGAYYTFQEMPFNILESSVLNQMFNEAQRSQTFTFPIFVDNVPEGVEELQLTLSHRPDDQLQPGSVNVTPAVATVRIQDFSSVVVGFERSLYTVGEEDGQVELCVNITLPRRQDIGAVTFSLTVETQDGSAVSNDDYTNVSMTMGTFTSQRSRQCFNVLITDDANIERTENFITRLTLIPESVTTINASRIVVDPLETTVQIADNDLMIVVGYNRTNVNAFEADRPTEVIVSISKPAQADPIETSFYLLVNTQDGTATAPGDYGNLTNFPLGPFNDSVRELSFNVSIVNDSTPEDAKMFCASLTLDSADQAELVDIVTVSPDVATVTILDNDGKPLMTMKIVVIAVGYIQTTVTIHENDGVAQLQLTVAIFAPQLDVSFSLLVNTSDGTATAPGDYGALTNFPLGPFNNSVRELSFTVSIVNDIITEDTEMFNVSLTLDPADQDRLGNRTCVTVLPGVATVTIQDDEAITVGFVETAVNVSESEEMAQLTVAISMPSEANSFEALFILLVNTLNETATATAPGDYGNLTNFPLGPFNDSVREISFNLSIVNDNITEDTEMFNISLTLNPADHDRLGDRVTVSPDVATVTIQDNDELWVGYNVTNVTVPESDEVATLTVAISMPPGPIETSFSLIVNTSDGTTAAGDYRTLTNFPLSSFSDDVRELSINVSIMNDNIPEDDEMFNVSLTLDPASQTRLGNRVTVSPDVATVTIQDNDGIIVGYNVTAVNVSEIDGVAQMTVAISMPPGADPIQTSFSLIANTLDGTATAPCDYVALTNFPLGPFSDDMRELSFNVSIMNDSIPEDDETFNVSLTLDSADQARLGDRVIVSPDVATVIIQDNDEIIVGYIVTDVNVSESDGEATLTVAITVPTDPIETSFSLIVNTIDGTATAPGDYGTLMTNIFRLASLNNDDVRELSFNVSIVNDNIPEDVEMFNVSLTLDPADQDRLGDRVTVSQDVATITIQDDDTITVGFVETAVNVSESDGVAQLTVGISMPPENISIETSFSLLVNTATDVAFFSRRNITANTRAAAFCDYGGLTNISLGPFNNDTRELSFNVSIVNDNSPELAEIFYVRLSPNHTDQARLDNRMAVSPDVGTVTIEDNDEITVGYNQTDVTVSESDGVACLTVKIFMPREEVPIDSEVMFSLLVNTSDGMERATSDVDYNALTNFPLGPFSDDVREISFNVSIVNDNKQEDDEKFRIILDLDSAGQAMLGNRVIVSPNVATVTILDDEIVVGYVQASVNVSESGGVAQLTVNTSMPSGGVPNEMSIYLIVDTSDETAIASSDYDNLTNYRLGPFNNSVRQLSFDVSILSDNITEDDEMFSATFTLDPATETMLGNRVVVSPNVINVTIQDDDVITVGYIQVTVNVSESDGVAQLTVAISMLPENISIETSFSLLVNTIDGSEDLPAPGDYGNLTNFSLDPFNDSVREISFNVSIVNDNITEDTEMFNVSLTLHPAAEARLGNRVIVSPDVAIVTIQDNDGANGILTAHTEWLPVPTTQLSTLVSYSMTPSPSLTAVGTPVNLGVILGSTFAAMVVLLCIGIAGIAIVYLRRKQHTKKVDLTRIDEMKEINPYIAQGSQMTHDLYTDVPKLLISSNSIRLLNVVGQGEFGVVYKAHLVKSMQQMPEIVAVKTLKGFFDQRSAMDMMKESAKMQGFDHPHVLSITGVCVDAGSAPYIVMPFMANGSLLAYIKKEKMSLVIPNDTADEELATVALKRLVDMCIQIGKGMEYLASKKIVHRDLAARNCMIDAHFVIKVADFGLSENMYSKTYFRQEKDQGVKLPVKWLALEALTEGVFSEKSDVWSYGVTCWELFTGGKVPYPGVDPVSLPHLLESGHRLDKPNNAACSEEIYLFMLKCWQGDPEERPTFSELVSLLSLTLESLAGYMDVSTFGKLEVHGEDPHNEGICDKGTNEEDPRDEGTHSKDTHEEDPHCETKV